MPKPQNAIVIKINPTDFVHLTINANLFFLHVKIVYNTVIVNK